MKNSAVILSGVTIALGLGLFSQPALPPENAYVESSRASLSSSDTRDGFLQAKEDSEPAQPTAQFADKTREISATVSGATHTEVVQENYLAEEPTEYDSAANVARVLDDRFIGEVYDSAWAAQVENETWEEFYAADLPNSDIDHVQCRSTLCKIAVTHQDTEAETTFKRTLLASLNGRSGYFEDHITGSGERSTVLYRYR